MAKLPISRVVDVTLTREDNFATRTGFGVALILSTTAVADQVDSTHRTKLYGSMDEVAEDWISTTPAYKSALAVFSQNPRPKQLKIGFIDDGVLTEPTPLPTMQAELDAIYAADPDWYWLLFTSEIRDEAALDDAIDWIETKSRILLLDSNDVATEAAGTATSIAARNKVTHERTAVFYHTDAAANLAAAAVGYCARRDLDQANTAYTLKFKKLIGQSPINKGSSVVQAVTGFVPATGLDSAQGHLANTYVEIGGLQMVVEGNVLSGAFIDEIHAGDWIIARTQEEELSRLANNDAIPMTNEGVQILVDGVEAVLGRAFVAGLIAGMTDPDTGEELPAYQIRVERVEDLLASQRRQRIAPVIEATFRYSGAVHYASVRYTMTF